MIGRGLELDEIARALAEHRVVTLRGPPGVGKTRLATEHLAKGDEAETLPHLFLDVTGARQSAELCAIVARGLDLEPGAEVPDAAVLGRLLAERGPLLVVLDNFEQASRAAPETLGLWLELSPETAWLITSRERLALPFGDEREIEIRPLSTADAIELFVDRASLADREFSPSAEDQKHLERLVAELDRLPLAIELCASRAGVLSPEQLVRELERGRELISSPTQTAFGELRGLGEAIDSSWAALTPNERITLEHCSTFVGPFSAQAAAYVVGPATQGREPLFDVIQRLVDRSLVSPVDTKGATGRRFRMLLCIADLAKNRLKRSGGWDAACQRHAEYFTQLGRASSQRTIARQDLEARRSLEYIREELLAIHQRGMVGDGGLPRAFAVQAALALVPWYRRFGPFSALLSLLDRALKAAGPDLLPILACKAIGARGSTLRLMGRLDEARVDLERAAHMASELGNPLLAALLDSELAQTDLERGDHVAAKNRLEAVLGVYRAHQQRVLEGHALLLLGGMHYFVDDLDAAQRSYEQALAVHREVDDRIYECEALRGLALVELELGRRGSARAHFVQALEAIERVNERRWRPLTLGYFAILEQEEGEQRRATSLYADAIAEAQWVGSFRLAAMFRGYLGTCLLEQGALDDARAALQRAIDDLGVFERMASRALFRSCLAVIDAASADVDAAERELGLARSELDRSPEQVFLRRAVEVHAGHVDLAKARAAAAAGHAADSEALRSAARGRLDVSGFAQSDVRFAQRLLARALEGQIQPGPEKVWKIHETGLWFEPPYGERVELGRKHALRRLLVRLAEAHRAGSEIPLAAGELIAAGWPGERIQEHAAKNRLRVALHTLRRLGLSDLLATHADGYRLDPSGRVEVVSG